MPSSGHSTPVATGKWLSIVGIGEDGVAGLSHAARELVSAARIVYGGRRHLELAAELVRGETRAWPSPFVTAVKEIATLRGTPVCVLASGDPFHHGAGATLAREIDVSEMTVIPQASAFTLAASRMGWALQEATAISVHGRPIESLRPLLQPGRRIIALTSDAAGPSEIADYLARHGFGRSRLTILEAIGGDQERVSSCTAEAFAANGIHPLNVVAIEVSGDTDARILPLAPGVPDEWFGHDGQITKRDIRAMTLSALSPKHGDLLWDVGAGSGSIGIEWLLVDPSLRAIAIEKDDARAARIVANAHALGVPRLRVIRGMAPEALQGLEAPDAVFVGGGASGGAVIETAMDHLRMGGRLVVNAVTLETEAALLAFRGAHGGELVRMAISRAAPVGSKSGWRPAMPVTQWSWVKR